MDPLKRNPGELLVSALELSRKGDLTSALVRAVQAERLLKDARVSKSEEARKLRKEIIRALIQRPGDQPSFRWSELGLLLDGQGKIVLRFRTGSLPYLFLQALAQGPHPIDDLLEMLRSKVRGKEDLYILVSRLNSKVPGLIENQLGKYRLKHCSPIGER